MVKKWVAAKKRMHGSDENGGNRTVKETTELGGKKEIEAIWSIEQKELSQRSLLGVCVKPIEFRRVMNLLLDEWKRPGEIEFRDVGPYRCLISFSSTDIRDEAMSNELLLSVFDKVRPHWDFLWSLSRHVWIEVMGLPLNLWCCENFHSISKIWGKFILMDDRTEEPKSFTTARIMLDCFQWERIHEWSPAKEEATMTMSGQANLKWKNIEDLLINVIINRILGYVHEVNIEREIGGGRDGESVFERLNRKKITDECYIKGVRNRMKKKNDADMRFGPKNPSATMNSVSGSSSSYPYPPRFGPCTGQTHCHRELVRAKSRLQFVDGNTEFWSSLMKAIAIEGCEVAGVLADDEVSSSETSYRVNSGVEEWENSSTAELVSLVQGGGSVVVETGEEDLRSDETLYRINKGGLSEKYQAEDIVSEKNFVYIGGEPDRAPISEGYSEGAHKGKETDTATFDEIPKQGQNVNEEFSEDDNSIEGAVAKGVWDKGGIFFNSSDEEEVVARLTGRKVNGKKRSKKHRQIRNPPCISERTLATRRLRLGSKSQLK
ncbi:hypothetical protein PIB30_054382 [Stylosanthes scabra]|uniref:DUF4283 domain-containing protein n=1 Tax=Stylosanthes scabra TaxID=79078 RepID=A0ABU6TII9_9FABA|nr:hypothetical protein [Stylosanthes scabra]